MPDSPLTYIIGAIVSIVGAVLLYYGTRFTANRAKEGVEQTSKVDAQESALHAWQELLQPYRDEVASCRAEIGQLRSESDHDRREHEKEIKAERAAREKQVQLLTERIDLLTLQLTEWKRLARVIARWATTLRDQVLKLGGTVPTTPEELLTLQALEDAEDKRFG